MEDGGIRAQQEIRTSVEDCVALSSNVPDWTSTYTERQRLRSVQKAGMWSPGSEASENLGVSRPGCSRVLSPRRSLNQPHSRSLSLSWATGAPGPPQWRRICFYVV